MLVFVWRVSFCDVSRRSHSASSSARRRRYLHSIRCSIAGLCMPVGCTAGLAKATADVPTRICVILRVTPSRLGCGGQVGRCCRSASVGPNSSSWCDCQPIKFGTDHCRDDQDTHRGRNLLRTCLCVSFAMPQMNTKCLTSLKLLNKRTLRPFQGTGIHRVGFDFLSSSAYFASCLLREP